MSRRAFSEKTGQVVYKHCWQATKGAYSASPPSYISLTHAHARNLLPYGLLKPRLDPPLSDQGASEDDAPSYADTVDEINTSIEPFGFQLKRFVDEYSGKPWTAFVNTKSDDLAKVATEYTPQEIAYFRTLVSAALLACT